MYNTKNIYMKKERMSLVLVLFLVLAMVFTPLQGFAADETANAAPDKITVYVNGVSKTYEPAAVNVKGSIMVPIKAIAEDLDAVVAWNSERKEVKITRGSKSSSVRLGSYTAFVGSTVVTLPQVPFISEGHTLVPLRFVAESLGMEVAWDSATKTVFITEKSESSTTASTVKNSTVPTFLTYEEAIRIGVPKSAQYTNANFNAQKAELSNDELEVPLGIYVTTLITAKNDLKMMDKWGKMNLAITREQVEFAIRTQMDNLSILLAEKEMVQAKTDAMEYAHYISGLKYKNGLISKNDFTTSEYNLNVQKAKVAALNKEIEGAYIALNSALGYPASARYTLEFTSTYAPVEETSIDRKVSTGMATDPYLWLSKESESSSKLKLDLYEYNLATKSWSMTNIDLQQATKDLYNMENAYDTTIRDRLNKLEQLEANIGSLELTIAQTEKQINLLRLQYDLGMAIKADLMTALAGLSELEFNLRQLQVQHSQLKSTYTIPYLNPTYAV